MSEMNPQLESEYDYYLGRVAGDVLGMAFGAGTCLVGAAQIGDSILAGAAVSVTSLGGLTIGGVVIIASGVAAGSATVAAGVGITAMAASNFGNDWDNLNEASTRERMGVQNGNSPRSNQAQNKSFNDVINKLGLNKAQARQLHNIITGEGLGYQEMLEIAIELFGNK